MNDSAHQFGQVRAIAVDPRQFGRLFVGTGGRGVVLCEFRSLQTAPDGAPTLLD